MKFEMKAIRGREIPFFPFIPILPILGLGLLIGNFYLSFKVFQKLKTQESSSPSRRKREEQFEKEAFIHSENLNPDDFSHQQAF